MLSSSTIRRQPKRDACVRSGGKHAIDVCGATAGLIFLAPSLLVVSLLIRLESKGPALFRQRRNGLSGDPFVIYKFRTLRVQENGDKVIQATRDDPRLTRVGAFLRRSSVDDPPQFHDAAYIEYWSLWLDIQILVKTVIKLPFGSSAY